MPDDNPKHLLPSSTSGSIRRMQAREIRELEMEWNGKTTKPPLQVFQMQEADLMANWRRRFHGPPAPAGRHCYRTPAASVQAFGGSFSRLAGPLFSFFLYSGIARLNADNRSVVLLQVAHLNH